MKFSLIRDLEAEGLLDSFLVSAVGSILVIRGYLQLTGYPQIGGGGLHIAHMLWGGLFMLIALIFSIVILNREKYYLVAILGGIGFGTFIDEVGKFITRDNNYFFEPTVSIVYAVFILIYLALKFIENHTKPTQEEYLINSLEIIKQALVTSISSEKFSKAKIFLSYVKPSAERAELQDLLQKLEVHISDKANLFSSVKSKLIMFYQKITSKSIFKWIVILFFISQAIYTLSHAAISTEIITDYIFQKQNSQQQTVGSFDELGNILSSALSGLIIVVGIFVMFKSRLKSYQLFRIAILINIFLTQFFDFYNNQFEALYGFLFNLLILITLKFMIDREKLSI